MSDDPDSAPAPEGVPMPSPMSEIGDPPIPKARYPNGNELQKKRTLMFLTKKHFSKWRNTKRLVTN